MKNRNGIPNHIPNKVLEVIGDLSNALMPGEPITTSLTKILKFLPLALQRKLTYLAILKLNNIPANNQPYNFHLELRSFSRTLLNLVSFVTRKDLHQLPYVVSELDNPFVKSLQQRQIIISTDLQKILLPIISEKKIPRILPIINKVVQSVISVPLFVKNKSLGNIVIGWSGTKINSFEKDILTIFANQASLAIYNSNLIDKQASQLEDLQTQNHDLESLYNLTKSVTKSLNMKTVIQQAVDSLPQDKTMYGAVLTIYDPQKNMLVVKAATLNKYSQKAQKLLGGFEKYPVDLNRKDYLNTPTAISFLKKKILLLDDMVEILCPPIPRKMVLLINKFLPIKSIFLTPIIIHNKAVGTIAYLLKQHSPSDINQRLKQILTMYTDQIAIALDNAHIFKEKEQARHKLNETSQILENVNKKLAKEIVKINELRTQERDMVDIMGHELRTPLSVARINFPRLKLVSRAIEGKQESFNTLSKRIYEALKREASLIESLLTATKLENDKIELVFSDVSPMSLITNTIDAFEYLAQQKGLILCIRNINKIKLLPLITADTTRVQEILDNLVSNAIKYSHKGTITIIVTQKNNDDYVTFTIKDMGEGIPVAEIKNLGQKFYRINQHIDYKLQTLKTKLVRPGGTGIGLFVVFGLVKAHHGEMKIKSKLGKGSEFSFTIPISKSSSTKQQVVNSKSINLFERYQLKRADS